MDLNKFLSWLCPVCRLRSQSAAINRGQRFLGCLPRRCVWFSGKKNTSPGDVLLMESLVRENRPRIEVRAEAFAHEKHEGQTK